MVRYGRLFRVAATRGGRAGYDPRWTVATSLWAESYRAVRAWHGGLAAPARFPHLPRRRRSRARPRFAGMRRVWHRSPRRRADRSTPTRQGRWWSRPCQLAVPASLLRRQCIPGGNRDTVRRSRRAQILPRQLAMPRLLDLTKIRRYAG